MRCALVPLKKQGKASAQAESDLPSEQVRVGEQRPLASGVTRYPGNPVLLKCKYLPTSPGVLKISSGRETIFGNPLNIQPGGTVHQVQST